MPPSDQQCAKYLSNLFCEYYNKSQCCPLYYINRFHSKLTQKVFATPGCLKHSFQVSPYGDFSSIVAFPNISFLAIFVLHPRLMQTLTLSRLALKTDSLTVEDLGSHLADIAGTNLSLFQQHSALFASKIVAFRYSGAGIERVLDQQSQQNAKANLRNLN